MVENPPSVASLAVHPALLHIIQNVLQLQGPNYENLDDLYDVFVALHENAIFTPMDLAQLSKKDLQKLGLKIGHKNKIQTFASWIRSMPRNAKPGTVKPTIVKPSTLEDYMKLSNDDFESYRYLCDSKSESTRSSSAESRSRCTQKKDPARAPNGHEDDEPQAEEPIIGRNIHFTEIPMPKDEASKDTDVGKTDVTLEAGADQQWPCKMLSSVANDPPLSHGEVAIDKVGTAENIALAAAADGALVLVPRIRGQTLPNAQNLFEDDLTLNQEGSVKAPDIEVGHPTPEVQGADVPEVKDAGGKSLTDDVNKVEDVPAAEHGDKVGQGPGPVLNMHKAVAKTHSTAPAKANPKAPAKSKSHYTAQPVAKTDSSTASAKANPMPPAKSKSYYTAQPVAKTDSTASAKANPKAPAVAKPMMTGTAYAIRVLE
ncbi:hypothetical protein SEMRO_321_G116840.1 [Seminavis robusta]|uniref:SAM domain-containing protein n=1 Tax=Seminavis robusta TaxID=568900 RepID=A0A9N8DSJ0_9STRA|nr:hypothetical protein SEMRO_321_G116840.1 [Seminavis robusta]|eukprot:Sro321_g116840.1 n/a (429) ;mRNA; r:62097-63592